MSQELINKATEYLANGGLFNPESMEHEKVRDLIYQMRNEIASLKKGLANMTYSNASYRETAETWREAAVERDALKKELANEKDAHELCHAHRLALAKELEIARGERDEQNLYRKAHEAQIERMTSESFDDGETFK